MKNTIEYYEETVEFWPESQRTVQCDNGSACSAWRWVMQFLPGASKWQQCWGLS